MIAWIHTYRPRPAWYELDSAQQRNLTDEWETVADSTENGDRVSRLGPLSVRGQSAQERVEVWTFPDLAALNRYWNRLRAAGYADWRESDNTVATEPREFIAD